MKSKGCEFGTYNGVSYRICYGLTTEGKMDYSKELYEFKKHCQCPTCNRRLKYDREPVNQLTITTDDKSKFDEITNNIISYICNSDRKIENVYIRV